MCKNNDEKLKDTYIQFRISANDKAILKERAEKMKMTLSQYIVYYLFNK